MCVAWGDVFVLLSFLVVSGVVLLWRFVIRGVWGLGRFFFSSCHVLRSSMVCVILVRFNGVVMGVASLFVFLVYADFIACEI